MKLLYYSTAYFARHGGSNHSRQFFAYAQKHLLMKEAMLFPQQGGNSQGDGKKSSLRVLLRSVGLLQIFFFYRRNKFHLDPLIQRIEKDRPDAVLMRVDSNFLQVEKLRKRFPKLIVATEINASPFDESFKNIAFRNYFRRMERSNLKAADLNFFVSANLRDHIMQDVLDETRDHVVHNGVDTRVFFPVADKSGLRMNMGMPNDSFIIGYIGTLDTHKHVDVLIRAFARVREKMASARLLIVGDGPDRMRLEALCEPLQMLPSVTFTGWRPHHEVPAYINCLDIAVHHHAGDYMSPLKLFEYMACKVPVIGPGTHAVKEVFTDQRELLITSGTVEDLALKILELAGNPGQSNKLAENAARLVTSSYTWEANVDFIISRIHDKLNAGKLNATNI